MTTGDFVTFKDGRAKGRKFLIQSVNDKTYLPPFKEPKQCVDVTFQAFGCVAIIRRCKKDLLEIVE